MATVFIRIELRGTPGEQVYRNLHAGMESLGWSRTISGTGGVTPLPSAMYQGNYDGSISELAAALQNSTVVPLWAEGSAVLTMRAGTDWAQSGWWWPE